MSANALFGPPPATLEILLDDPDEHDFPEPARILAGLTADQACRVPTGLLYSIANVVAHMLANMTFNLELIRGDTAERHQSRSEMWHGVRRRRVDKDGLTRPTLLEMNQPQAKLVASNTPFGTAWFGPRQRAHPGCLAMASMRLIDDIIEPVP